MIGAASPRPMQEYVAMTGPKGPRGHDVALAQAALATLARKEKRMAAGFAPARTSVLPPVLPLWREASQREIRLIDLERRAHFARLAS